MSKLPPSLQIGSSIDFVVLKGSCLIPHASPDPVHVDADLRVPGVELDLGDVPLQPVIQLVQAHAARVAASAGGVAGRGVRHRPPRLL